MNLPLVYSLRLIIKVCKRNSISHTDGFFAVCFYAITSHYVLSTQPVPRHGFAHLLYYKFSGRSYRPPSHFATYTQEQDGNIVQWVNSKKNERDAIHYFKNLTMIENRGPKNFPFINKLLDYDVASADW